MNHPVRNELISYPEVKIPVLVCVLMDGKGDFKNLVDFFSSIPSMLYRIEDSFPELHQTFNTDEEGLQYFLKEIQKAKSKNRDIKTIMLYSDYNTNVFKMLKDQFDGVFTFDLIRVGDTALQAF